MLQDKVTLQVGGSGRKFQPVPSSIYTVQISDVNSVDAMSTFSGKVETLLNFEFVILDSKNFDYKNEDGETEIETTRGRRLWKRMRPVISDGSKGKASWLYKLLCAVEKKTQSSDYFASIDPNTLINSQVMVMVTKAPGKDKKEYNNILDFQACEKELTPFETADKDQPQEEIAVNEDEFETFVAKQKSQ